MEIVSEPNSEKDNKKNTVYKFNQNLLKASNSENIDDAKKEWIFAFYTYIPKLDDNYICICNHKIQHINYFYNILNKNEIKCGTTCCKKFDFDNKEVNNKYLKPILKKFFEKRHKGEYKEISFPDYLELTKEQLYNDLNKYIKSLNLNKLDDLYKELEDCIKNYNLQFFIDIKNKIKEVQNQHEINRQEYQEKQRQIYIQQEEQKKEQEYQKQLKKEQEYKKQLKKEQEKLDKNYCNCGITIKCICKIPEYKKEQSGNLLFCIKCDKWHCINCK